MIRNIIFDWCGTLVDDLPAVWRATNRIFSKAGIPELSLDEFRAEFCLPFKSFYDRYTPHIPMPTLEEWFHAFFREEQESVAEMPHAREFLECCRQRGIRVFVLSSIHRRHFDAHLARNGFDAFIEKPYLEAWDKREQIHRLIEENGLDPSETLMVGDMQHDIDTAKHGGIHSCGVLTGFNRVEQLRASEPDLLVEHLGELKHILDSAGWEIDLVAGLSPHLMPVSTVGALIANERNELLMIRTRKWSNLWGIPGGKIRFGEASIAALRREILEETALEIRDIEFVLVQDCINSREFYRQAHFVLLNYFCRVAGDTIVRLNDEAEESKWLPVAQALELPLNTPTRILIEAVLKQGLLG